jgi:DNA-directed RNA polymerase sigma subunit (sigma70/sigma32)
MTYRVEDLRTNVKRLGWLDLDRKQTQHVRDKLLRDGYRDGATLQQLADATGLTRQRIQQIVSERGER